jgi:CBS-domain-containing membrane protein
VTPEPRPSFLPRVDAAVPRSATFREAAHVLCASGLSAIAVLDEHRRVVGLFTEDDFLAGLFPSYLAELRHTAFAPEELEAATARALTTAGEPVERHMRPPVAVEAGSSTLHVAEVFLHCDWGALALVERGRFVGMLAQFEFCRRLLPALAD